MQVDFNYSLGKYTSITAHYCPAIHMVGNAVYWSIQLHFNSQRFKKNYKKVEDPKVLSTITITSL